MIHRGMARRPTASAFSPVQEADKQAPPHSEIPVDRLPVGFRDGAKHATRREIPMRKKHAPDQPLGCRTVPNPTFSTLPAHAADNCPRLNEQFILTINADSIY